MNIITKFQPGDTAFRLSGNKVQEVEIAHIQINVKPRTSLYGGDGPNPVVEICYTLDLPGNVRDNYEYEGTIFATKAELLASL
jgi:hypothetical protein